MPDIAVVRKGLGKRGEREKEENELLLCIVMQPLNIY